MVRKYYTLLTRDPGDLWVPQFGDYDRAVVAQEGDDTRHHYETGTKLKIITTGDKQRDIDAVINEMNKRLIERQKQDAFNENVQKFGPPEGEE